MNAWYVDLDETGWQVHMSALETLAADSMEGRVERHCLRSVPVEKMQGERPSLEWMALGQKSELMLSSVTDICA
jgi:hypothetical protein